jgi:ribose 1,5-bisphosphokinase
MNGPAAAPGALVCVVGPSGAGKDTLIELARGRLGEAAGVAFPRRLVTRSASAFEDNDALTEAAFAAGVAENAFALHWRAHGLGYALPGSVRTAVEGGEVAVCNVSRLAVAPAKTLFAVVRTVLITAPEAVRAARIAARGRESLEDAAARVARGRALGRVEADLAIDNVGDPQEGADRLVAFLRNLVALRRSATATAADAVS